MFKHVVMLSVVAAVVLAMAPAAQAVSVPVPILNGSFEETAGIVVSGTTYYRGVDWWDVQQDGFLDGNGFIHGTTTLLGGQPTTNTNPRYWTTTETEADACAFDARWPQYDNATNAGPTDGWQSLLFDKRGTTGANSNIKQSLGTASTFGTGTALVMSFDARFGEPGNTLNGGQAWEDTNTNFYSFFNVNGTRDTVNQFVSNMGTVAQGRLIKAWNEMGYSGTNLPPTTVTASPVPAVGVGLSSQADNMGHFTVTLPLTGLNPSDAVEIGFWYGKLTGVANVTSNGTRVNVDNVRVSLTIPTTISAAAGDWHTPATWNPAAVPLPVTPAEVGASASGHAVTITTATADCYSLKVSSGSVSSTGQILNIASTGTDALSTTGGTLALDAASTLNIAKANTSASFAGLTVGSGTVLNVTSELTVDSAKNLSGATINTPKVTLASGTLTKTDGLTIGSGKLISGNGTVAGTVTVASGGKVSPGTDTTIAAINASSLTLDSGSLLTFNMDSSPDQIITTDINGLTINGGAITVLNSTGTGPVTSVSGPYSLIGYAGAIQGAGVSALSVANPVAGLRYGFSASGTTVALNVTQGPVWSDLVGGGSWSNPANWSGVTPLSTETLVYSASGASGSSVNDLTGASFKSIQFNSGVNAFTLSGNSLTLTGDPSANVVLNNSTNIQTVNMPITLTGPASLNAASGPIVIDSASTITNGGFDLTIKGAQPVTLNGAITGLGGVIRSTDAGTLNINSATALGTGTFTINGGKIDNTSSGGAVTLSTVTPETWAGSFTFTGTNDLNLGTGAVTLNANITATISAKTLTVGGTITGTANTLTVVSPGNNTGTLVISSANNSVSKLTLGNYGWVRIDNSVAASPSFTSAQQIDVGTDNQQSGQSLTLDINNATVNCAGISIRGKSGQVIVRGNSILNTTGNIHSQSDATVHTYIFQDNAIIHGENVWLRTSWTQAEESNYIALRNNAQANFNTVELIGNGEYANGYGHQTLLEVQDTAQLTASADMYVMRATRDANRTGICRDFVEVYQHGGTVTVGGNLRLCDNDTAKSSASPVHQTWGAYNLGSGSTLNVGGIITGGATRTGVGQSYFNFHGGTLAYTGTVPRTDWINLTVTAGDPGIDSTQNLRVWEGATIDTGSQNVTINQALLAPTGQGISAIATTGLTTAVYNNGMAPWVLITPATGDTGNGATAVATLDATGHVNGIVITNPGNNYTVAPSIVLERASGGTTQTVPAGQITLASNSSYTGGLTKKGSGNLILTGASTYAGATAINNGSIVVSGIADDRLPVGTTVTLGGTGTSGKLVLGDATAARNQTLAGLGTTGLGGTVVGGNASTNSILTLNIASTASLNGGVLGGAGANENNLGLTKIGAGTLALSGTSTYVGGTTVNVGTLQVDSAGALPAGQALTIGAGGTVVLSSGLTNAAATNAATSATAVPEPGTIALLAAGLAGLLVMAWRRRR